MAKSGEEGEEIICFFESREEAVEKKSGREDGREERKRAFGFSHFCLGHFVRLGNHPRAHFLFLLCNLISIAKDFPEHL